MHSSNFLSTCIPNAVVNYLLFQSLCWEVEKYCNTPHGKIDVCGVWCQLERDRQPGCALWKLTKLEPNIQHTRLPMWSTGNCALVVQRGTLPIEIWTTDRQTGWKVRYLCQSRPDWQQPVLSNELHCVCVVHSGNLCHEVVSTSVGT